jgi:hypothetical protein
MIAERNQQMKKAVGVLMELSADQRARMLYDEREKARRDEDSRIGGAERRGRSEMANAMARKMLLRNRPIDEIMDYTELSREAIEQLRVN